MLNSLWHPTGNSLKYLAALIPVLVTSIPDRLRVRVRLKLFPLTSMRVPQGFPARYRDMQAHNLLCLHTSEMVAEKIQIDHKKS